ncbi:MAG: ATP-grasp domain-containing protein [Peptococcaceae bacterium]|nr:ATP-grasp domain-containing protein [Peptococcaceae bacterium]
MTTVLLTDGQQRKTLAAARSLGRQGLTVIVGEDTRWATAAFSKYCRKRIVYPHPRTNPRSFWEKLMEVIEEYHVETLFPMDDEISELVIKQQDQLKSSCHLLLPREEDYRIAADKGLATGLVRKIGVDCPLGIEPETEKDLENVSAVDKQWKFPLVIKPRKSSGSRGIVYMTAEREPGELENVYQEIIRHSPFALVQECIPTGTKYDVCLLYDQSSNLKASFVQKEIRHFPLDKGPSTVQESVWRPDLVEKADAIMKSLHWKGIAEVEFIHDPRDGKDKFMEINPRFWGSLQLAILSGVDFPWLYYRLIMGKSVKTVSLYQLGIKCRWLFPGDILHFLSNKNRWKMDPPFFAGAKKGINDDILSRNDIMPLAGFILAALHYLPDRNMWRQIFDR